MMIKEMMAFCKTVWQTAWLLITWAHEHKTYNTTLKECPFPQLSSVEAGGSTAFIYANFSVPVMEVNIIRGAKSSLFCLRVISASSMIIFPSLTFSGAAVKMLKGQTGQQQPWDILPQYCYCIVERHWKMFFVLIIEQQRKVYQATPAV